MVLVGFVEPRIVEKSDEENKKREKNLGKIKNVMRAARWATTETNVPRDRQIQMKMKNKDKKIKGAVMLHGMMMHAQPSEVLIDSQANISIIHPSLL